MGNVTLDTAHTTSYQTLIETMRLFCIVFGIQRAICHMSPILPSSHLHLVPPLGRPRGLSLRSLSAESLEYRLRDAMFSHFSTTPTCDRQTYTGP